MTLMELERNRKELVGEVEKFKKVSLKAPFILLAFFIFIAIVLIFIASLNTAVATILVFVVVFVLYCLAAYTKLLDLSAIAIGFKTLERDIKQKYSYLYKRKFLKENLENRGFKYNEFNKFSHSDIITSGLVVQNYTLGNDCITGEFNGFKFAFTDLEFYQYEGKSRYGLFFMADYKRTLTAKIYIYNKFDFVKSPYKKIHFDNAKFNKLFYVYSDDTINAMYLLTPSLLEKISNLEKHFGKNISISFLNQKLYIYIKTSKDSFEPDLYKSAIKHNQLSKILRDLNALIDLGKAVNLGNLVS